MKTRNWFLSAVLILIAGISLFAGGKAEKSVNGDSDKPVTLRIGYGIPNTSITGKYVGLWADKVTEATKGRVKFQIYPSGQLGTLVEMIEAVNLKTLDITFNDPSLMVSYLPEISLLSQPMLIKDYKHWDAVVKGEVGKKLAEKLESSSNMHILGWVRNGFRNMISKKPLTSLQDCKGLIMRSPESDVYIDMFKLLGMVPTPIPYGEIYTAMQTSVVEACDTSFENFVIASFYEQGKYVLNSNHMAATMSLVINKAIWTSFSVEDRKTMERIYNEAFDECNNDVAAAEQKYKQKLIELGCKVSVFSEQDQAVILKLFSDYWVKFAKKNNCADLLQKVIELR